VISTLTTQHPEILKNANHEAMHKYELLKKNLQLLLHSPLKAPCQGEEPKCKEKWIAAKAFKTGAPAKPIEYLYLKIICFTLPSSM